jgi:hypothetical protein
MKASKFIVFAGGILGLIAFFLPFGTAEVEKGVRVSVSAFQVVKGISDVQEVVSSDEAKAKIDALDEAGKTEARKVVKEANNELDKIKGIIIGLFVPALLLALIGGLGVARKRFGRGAGVLSLLLGIVSALIGGGLHAAFGETDGGAGIAITILVLTGLAGIIGGIMALIKPERAAAA